MMQTSSLPSYIYIHTYIYIYKSLDCIDVLIKDNSKYQNNKECYSLLYGAYNYEAKPW